MISLEQIRTLEAKVHKAVNLLASVQEENLLLKNKLAGYETRIDELEFLIEEFREEQTEIEQGIISALSHLDHLEDAVVGLKNPTTGGIATTPVSQELSEEATEIFSAPVPDLAPVQTEQHFEQPLPVETLEAETYETELEDEPSEEQPNRERQLDIF